MWYFFTICSVALSILSHYVSKSKKSSYHLERLGLYNIFGHDVSTIFWASLTLLFIVVNLIFSEPGSRSLKDMKLHSELTVQQALGNYVAKTFAKDLVPGTKLLLINRIGGSTDEKLYHAFIEGFMNPIKSMNISIEQEILPLNDFPAPSQESNITQKLNMNANEFDGIVKKHKGCSAILSLTGIPDNYEGSSTSLKVADGDIRFGIVTDDVYLLGGLIINHEIAACVVPKRRYTFDRAFTASHSVEEIFNSRFHYVTHDNIFDIMRREQRLFKVTRRL